MATNGHQVGAPSTESPSTLMASTGGAGRGWRQLLARSRARRRKPTSKQQVASDHECQLTSTSSSDKHQQLDDHQHHSDHHKQQQQQADDLMSLYWTLNMRTKCGRIFDEVKQPKNQSEQSKQQVQDQTEGDLVGGELSIKEGNRMISSERPQDIRQQQQQVGSQRRPLGAVKSGQSTSSWSVKKKVNNDCAQLATWLAELATMPPAATAAAADASVNLSTLHDASASHKAREHAHQAPLDHARRSGSVAPKWSHESSAASLNTLTADRAGQSGLQRDGPTSNETHQQQPNSNQADESNELHFARRCFMNEADKSIRQPPIKEDTLEGGGGSCVWCKWPQLSSLEPPAHQAQVNNPRLNASCHHNHLQASDNLSALSASSSLLSQLLDSSLNQLIEIDNGSSTCNEHDDHEDHQQQQYRGAIGGAGSPRLDHQLHHRLSLNNDEVHHRLKEHASSVVDERDLLLVPRATHHQQKCNQQTTAAPPNGRADSRLSKTRHYAQRLAHVNQNCDRSSLSSSSTSSGTLSAAVAGDFERLRRQLLAHRHLKANQQQQQENKTPLPPPPSSSNGRHDCWKAPNSSEEKPTEARGSKQSSLDREQQFVTFDKVPPQPPPARTEHSSSFECTTTTFGSNNHHHHLNLMKRPSSDLASQSWPLANSEDLLECCPKLVAAASLGEQSRLHRRRRSRQNGDIAGPPPVASDGSIDDGEAPPLEMVSSSGAEGALRVTGIQSHGRPPFERCARLGGELINCSLMASTNNQHDSLLEMSKSAGGGSVVDLQLQLESEFQLRMQPACSLRSNCDNNNNNNNVPQVVAGSGGAKNLQPSATTTADNERGSPLECEHTNLSCHKCLGPSECPNAPGGGGCHSLGEGLQNDCISGADATSSCSNNSSSRGELRFINRAARIASSTRFEQDNPSKGSSGQSRGSPATSSLSSSTDVSSPSSSTSSCAVRVTATSDSSEDCFCAASNRGANGEDSKQQPALKSLQPLLPTPSPKATSTATSASSKPVPTNELKPPGPLTDSLPLPPASLSSKQNTIREYNEQLDRHQQRQQQQRKQQQRQGQPSEARDNHQQKRQPDEMGSVSSATRKLHNQQQQQHRQQQLKLDEGGGGGLLGGPLGRQTGNHNPKQYEPGASRIDLIWPPATREDKRANLIEQLHALEEGGHHHHQKLAEACGDGCEARRNLTASEVGLAAPDAPKASAILLQTDRLAARQHHQRINHYITKQHQLNQAAQLYARNQDSFVVLPLQRLNESPPTTANTTTTNQQQQQQSPSGAPIFSLDPSLEAAERVSMVEATASLARVVTSRESSRPSSSASMTNSQRGARRRRLAASDTNLSNWDQTCEPIYDVPSLPLINDQQQQLDGGQQQRQRCLSPDQKYPSGTQPQDILSGQAGKNSGNTNNQNSSHHRVSPSSKYCDTVGGVDQLDLRISSLAPTTDLLWPSKSTSAISKQATTHATDAMPTRSPPGDSLVFTPDSLDGHGRQQRDRRPELNISHRQHGQPAGGSHDDQREQRDLQHGDLHHERRSANAVRFVTQADAYGGKLFAFEGVRDGVGIGVEAGDAIGKQRPPRSDDNEHKSSEQRRQMTKKVAGTQANEPKSINQADATAEITTSTSTSTGSLSLLSENLITSRKHEAQQQQHQTAKLERVADHHHRQSRPLGQFGDDDASGLSPGLCSNSSCCCLSGELLAGSSSSWCSTSSTLRNEAESGPTSFGCSLCSSNSATTQSGSSMCSRCHSRAASIQSIASSMAMYNLRARSLRRHQRLDNCFSECGSSCSYLTMGTTGQQVISRRRRGGRGRGTGQRSPGSLTQAYLRRHRRRSRRRRRREGGHSHHRSGSRHAVRSKRRSCDNGRHMATNRLLSKLSRRRIRGEQRHLDCCNCDGRRCSTTSCRRVVGSHGGHAGCSRSSHGGHGGRLRQNRHEDADGARQASLESTSRRLRSAASSRNLYKVFQNDNDDQHHHHQTASDELRHEAGGRLSSAGLIGNEHATVGALWPGRRLGSGNAKQLGRLLASGELLEVLDEEEDEELARATSGQGESDFVGGQSGDGGQDAARMRSRRSSELGLTVGKWRARDDDDGDDAGHAPIGHGGSPWRSLMTGSPTGAHQHENQHQKLRAQLDHHRHHHHRQRAPSQPAPMMTKVGQGIEMFDDKWASSSGKHQHERELDKRQPGDSGDAEALKWRPASFDQAAAAAAGGGGGKINAPKLTPTSRGGRLSGSARDGDQDDYGDHDDLNQQVQQRARLGRPLPGPGAGGRDRDRKLAAGQQHSPSCSCRSRASYSPPPAALSPRKRSRELRRRQRHQDDAGSRRRKVALDDFVVDKSELRERIRWLRRKRRKLIRRLLEIEEQELSSLDTQLSGYSTPNAAATASAAAATTSSKQLKIANLSRQLGAVVGELKRRRDSYKAKRARLGFNKRPPGGDEEGAELIRRRRLDQDNNNNNEGDDQSRRLSLRASRRQHRLSRTNEGYPASGLLRWRHLQARQPRHRLISGLAHLANAPQAVRPAANSTTATTCCSSISCRQHRLGRHRRHRGHGRRCSTSTSCISGSLMTSLSRGAHLTTGSRRARRLQYEHSLRRRRHQRRHHQQRRDGARARQPPTSKRQTSRPRQFASLNDMSQQRVPTTSASKSFKTSGGQLAKWTTVDQLRNMQKALIESGGVATAAEARQQRYGVNDSSGVRAKATSNSRPVATKRHHHQLIASSLALNGDHNRHAGRNRRPLVGDARRNHNDRHHANSGSINGRGRHRPGGGGGAAIDMTDKFLIKKLAPVNLRLAKGINKSRLPFSWQLANHCQCKHCCLVETLVRMDMETKRRRKLLAVGADQLH